ncbi:MAG: hypothetical protein AAGA70_16710 [Pseudomonadota bacterium]
MTVTIFSDDIVDWRSGDPVWTVAGEVPLLSIGCPDVGTREFAEIFGGSFPVLRPSWASEPSNGTSKG